MKTTFRRWVGLGLGTAFLGTSVVACDAEDQNGVTSEQAKPVAEAPVAADSGPSEAHHHGMAGTPSGGGGEAGEGGEAGHDIGTLPLPERLAFMTGHVEAGLALYRAGEPEMAAPHLLHPVSETHQAERAGIDALGFDAALFETVSKALEEGQPAEEIEPQLLAAEENLAMVADKAGGDPAEIIRFLMDTVVEEYTIAINDGVVTDVGEYQDAWGFAVVALYWAEKMDPPRQDVLNNIEALINLWPEAPIPPDAPTPVGQVIAQTSKVVLALPAN